MDLHHEKPAYSSSRQSHDDNIGFSHVGLSSAGVTVQTEMCCVLPPSAILPSAVSRIFQSSPLRSGKEVWLVHVVLRNATEGWTWGGNHTRMQGPIMCCTCCPEKSHVLYREIQHELKMSRQAHVSFMQGHNMCCTVSDV